MFSDLHLFTRLAVALGFCLALPLFPFLQKERYLSGFSLIAAALWYQEAFVGFLLVSSIAYAAAYCCSTQTLPSRRWSAACLGIFAVIAVFTAGRVLHWDRPYAVQPSVSIILYSLEMWAVLRLLTLFWEVGSGSVAMPSPAKYILWICMPFSLSGPLLRLSQFPAVIQCDRKLWRSSDWWLEMLAAVAKLTAGISFGAAQAIISNRWPHFWANVLLTFVSGPLGFYLSTAGYFQLMEVLARPAGFQLPPSFNLPIGRQNIAEFWANWNMTATFMFRDYLFYNRWGMQTYNIYFNTILLFTLVGFWHAANPYWILWGFLHGVLFCSFLIWRKYKNVLEGVPLRGTRTANLMARVLTYAAVCLCWYVPSKLLQKMGYVLS